MSYLCLGFFPLLCMWFNNYSFQEPLATCSLPSIVNRKKANSTIAYFSLCCEVSQAVWSWCHSRRRNTRHSRLANEHRSGKDSRRAGDFSCMLTPWMIPGT